MAEPRDRSISAIPIGDEAPRVVNVVIEIPRGFTTKYEYDEGRDLLRIDGENRSSLPFPTDYGFVPRARSGDGDLLDIFVLGGGQIAPGTVVSVRPVGMLDMADDAGSDAKIIGIACTNVPLHAVLEISDLANTIREEIEAFLHAYKRQNGQQLTVKGWYGRTAAYLTIDAARERYRRLG